MAGDSESAVAAMLLVEALDAGPVAALERFDVGPDDDAGRGLRARARARAGALRARARATPRAGRLATVPQVGEPTYAAKITAADRALDPLRPARELHDRVRALSPHIGARLALDGAPHTIWRTRVRRRRPGRGSAGARRRRRRARLRRRGARAAASCRRRAAAACRPPTGCAACAARCPRRRPRERRPHPRPARAHARVRRGRVRRPRLLRRGRAGARRRARARPRHAPRVRGRAAPAHARRGARGDRRPAGAAPRAAARARAAARRLPDPVRRRNPAACSGFGERRAGAPRDRRPRDRPRQRRAAAHRQGGAGLVRRAARGHARGGRAAPFAARLDRRALVRRLRRGAGARALRGGQPRRRRCRCGRTRCATARPQSRPGCARRAPRPCATTRRACCASTGPLDVAGSHAFASGAVVPIARAAVLVAQRVGAGAGMRVLDLCAAPGGKTAVLAASGAPRDGRRRPSRPRQGARGDAAPPRSRGRGRRGRRPHATAAGPFDRILVDAPCSGLGVLAGRPDARWRRTPEDARSWPCSRSELVRHARDAARARRRAALRRLHAQPRRERGDRARRRPGRRTTSCAPGRTRATTASTPPALRARPCAAQRV